MVRTYHGLTLEGWNTGQTQHGGLLLSPDDELRKIHSHSIALATSTPPTYEERLSVDEESSKQTAINPAKNPTVVYF